MMYDLRNLYLVGKTWKFIQTGPKISELAALNFWLIDPVRAHLFTSFVRTCANSLEKLEIIELSSLETIRNLPPLPKLL